MKYGVLGTRMVGLAIGSRLAELGHEVLIGTRVPSRSSENMYLPLWLRLWGALENGMFNIRIVR